MKISPTSWADFVKKLSQLDETATKKVGDYITNYNGFDYENAEHMKDLVGYAFSISSKYGEASAALACEMYDAIGIGSGMFLPPALSAETASYKDVAKAVWGTSKNGNKQAIANSIGRLVKRTGQDTFLNNALRDGAQFAWIPNGDTCAFCLTLASRGWQKISKRALKNGHAEHIHANCDCTYAVRFDNKTQVPGYDPEVYRQMYDSAEGSSPNEKINALRRAIDDRNREKINARKRKNYAENILKEMMGNVKLEEIRDEAGYLVSKNELIDSIEKTPSVLGNYTPESLKAELESMGYAVKPLADGAFQDIPFENGGGYKINYDGDRLLQYHPENRSHHEGAYYKLSSGEEGTRWYDTNGNEILRRRKKQNR